MICVLISTFFILLYLFPTPSTLLLNQSLPGQQERWEKPEDGGKGSGNSKKLKFGSGGIATGLVQTVWTQKEEQKLFCCVRKPQSQM